MIHVGPIGVNPGTFAALLGKKKKKLSLNQDF